MEILTQNYQFKLYYIGMIKGVLSEEGETSEQANYNSNPAISERPSC